MFMFHVYNGQKSMKSNKSDFLLNPKYFTHPAWLSNRQSNLDKIIIQDEVQQNHNSSNKSNLKKEKRIPEHLWHEHRSAVDMMWTTFICQQQLSDLILTCLSHWLQVIKQLAWVSCWLRSMLLGDFCISKLCPHFTKTDRLHACTYWM